jgi:DNA-binding response OmpR family regulator
MEKKSSIAISFNSRELFEVLSQHPVIEAEFILKESSGSMEIAFLDDTNPLFLRIILKDKGSEIKLDKPYHLNQLFIQLSYLLHEKKENVCIGAFCLDPINNTLSLSGKNILLTEKETLVLHALIVAYPSVVTKQQLLSQVWGYSSEVDSQTLSTHIYRLRQKLGQEHNYIHTCDEGYVLQLP